MTATEAFADAPHPEPPPPAPPASRRILAGVGGAILLILAGMFTLGGAVVAVVGIAGAAMIARRRSRTLSLPMSWLTAGLSVQLALLALAGYAALKAPPGTMATIQRTMDSTQSNQPPPPAWLDRIAPGAAARARATRPTTGPALTKTTLVFGAILSTGIVAAIVGTVGWLAAFPLAYAVTGRWLGQAPTFQSL